MITSLRRSALVESRCRQRAAKMRFGKLGLLHFIILAWARTLFSPFDGVEAKNKTVYAVGINCVPGTFITNTGCQKCPNGTFSDKHNTTKCSPCDRCSGRHNEMVEPCTRSTNTKCSCQSGYYYDEDISFCLKCTPCKKGQGVVKNCTATSDTQCAFCVKGQTFSDAKSLQRCKPCLRCVEGHVVLKRCTRRTDTVCVREKDQNNSKVPRPKVAPGTAITRPPLRNRTTTTKKKRLKASTIPVSTEPISAQNQSMTVSNQEEDAGSEDDTELQVVLYSLIAVVVVLVVVFVFVCQYKKRRNRPRKKPKPGGEEPSTRSNSTDVIEAVENPYSSLPFISKPVSGQGKMLRDVPYTLISDLSFHLNPGERWKQLGGHLKFNSTQINTFALVKGNATQAMLVEWGQKDGATVVALQNTFRKMKWGKEERMVGKYV